MNGLKTCCLWIKLYGNQDVSSHSELHNTPPVGGCHFCLDTWSSGSGLSVWWLQSSLNHSDHCRENIFFISLSLETHNSTSQRHNTSVQITDKGKDQAFW